MPTRPSRCSSPRRPGETRNDAPTIPATLTLYSEGMRPSPPIALAPHRAPAVGAPPDQRASLPVARGREHEHRCARLRRESVESRRSVTRPDPERDLARLLRIEGGRGPEIQRDRIAARFERHLEPPAAG